MWAYITKQTRGNDTWTKRRRVKNTLEFTERWLEIPSTRIPHNSHRSFPFNPLHVSRRSDFPLRRYRRSRRSIISTCSLSLSFVPASLRFFSLTYPKRQHLCAGQWQTPCQRLFFIATHHRHRHRHYITITRERTHFQMGLRKKKGENEIWVTAFRRISTAIRSLALSCILNESFSPPYPICVSTTNRDIDAKQSALRRAPFLHYLGFLSSFFSWFLERDVSSLFSSLVNRFVTFNTIFQWLQFLSFFLWKWYNFDDLNWMH